MKKTVYFILSLLAFSIAASGQNLRLQEQVDAVSSAGFISENVFSAKPIPTDKAAALGEYVRNFSLLETDVFVLNEIVAEKPAALEVDIPFNGEVITLQLITSSAVNEQSVFFARNSSGKTPVNYTPGAYYYGVVKDRPNTLVAMSFFTDNVIGVIANDKGNYVLGKTNTPGNNSNEYILYNDKDLLVANNTACFTPDEAPDKVAIPQKQQQMMASCGTGPEVDAYIETDFQIYLDQGSDETNVLDYVTGLFNVTATIYQNELITTSISEVSIWTMADPYAGAMDTLDALTLFQSEMSGGFNGDLAHLFSARDLGGGRASDFGVLCGAMDQRTAVSGNLTDSTPEFPTYSWNAMVVTHEMGHCLGSRHTHACVWNGDDTAIDGCPGYTEGGCVLPGNPPGGGTIMSYCHVTAGGIDFNLGFGPQPGDVIRDHVNNSACLSCCSDVDITGVYDAPLTESGTWIVSSGQTTILSTADVRLDADGISGYIEFEPVDGNDFFLAEPAGDGVFVAEALDGCDTAIPAKADNPDADSATDDVKNIREEVPREGFLLEQNIPNPFSEATTIKASVPEGVIDAEVVIYNLQGVLLEAYPLRGRGAVTIEISGGKLPAGIYLYTLVADGRKIDTKKMILTK